ncbi:MAG: PRC-barrel domain containing protein [Sphingomicrobium sp.]
MENIATWVAPIATTFAALMTASNLGSRVTGWGFAVFLVGSIAWMTLGLATHQPNLVWQNVILSVLNLFGMWRWLGRQARIEEGGERAAAKSAALPSETLFPASLLSKAKLVGAGGQPLGTTIDAMIGRRSGRLAYLVIAEGGVAGVGERFRRLDWAAATVDDDSIRTATSSLDRLPELAPDDWPGR